MEDVLALIGETRIQMLDGSYDAMVENGDVERGYIDLERDGAYIRLVGPRDVWINEDEYSLDAMAIRYMRDYLKSVLTGEYYTILAVHRADLYPYLNDLNADLMLSGHLHGGVIRLPKVGGLLGHNPGSYLPAYDAGVYAESAMTMIVSRGCDLDWSRMRVFNGPEVIQITLRR